MALYFRHLKPGGILALHISNLYLDLAPVCARGAEAFGKQAMVDEDSPSDDSYLYKSDWVLLTSDPAWFQKSSFEGASLKPASAPPDFRPWTDDYSNVFKILTLK